MEIEGQEDQMVNGRIRSYAPLSVGSCSTMCVAVWTTEADVVLRESVPQGGWPYMSGLVEASCVSCCEVLWSAAWGAFGSSFYFWDSGKIIGWIVFCRFWLLFFTFHSSPPPLSNAGDKKRQLGHKNFANRRW